MINIQNIAVKANSSFQTVCPFPVGYIYQSTNSTSPANIFGGSWTALTDGRFMRYSGSWNSTGGETTHTLTVAEMPKHNHAYTAVGYSNYLYWGFSQSRGAVASYSVGDTWGPKIDDKETVQGITSVNAGSSSAHNNLPPYRTCYAWYRTA